MIKKLSILAVAAVVLAVILVPAATPHPGQTAFDKANSRIFAFDSDSGRVGFGNTPAAEELATRFSLTLQSLAPVIFEGGDPDRNSSLTQEHFLSWCELHDDRVCFLVHVPQLKNYRDDYVRETLVRLAWKTARAITQDLRHENDRVLGVGLRGAIAYGGLAVGMGEADPEIECGKVLGQRKLYDFFVGPTDESTAERQSNREPVHADPADENAANPPA